MTKTTVQEAPAPYGKAVTEFCTLDDQRVVLHGVSWSTYKALLNDLGDSRACRLAFDSGDLEIMSPHFKHGRSEFTLGQMVVVLVEEFGLDCVPGASLTCEREDIEKAIEPDGCFYIQHANDVADCEKIDLAIHPPPDLMIEVDISTNSSRKLAICAALGVPEHWLYNGSALEIRLLKSGRYIVSEESAVFPGIPLSKIIAEFLKPRRRLLLANSHDFRLRIREEMRALSAGKKKRRI
ncbi:MAG TPA: Uma2 family endonuclease [Planctomycetota bacterium]|nr:Uma2 family endonuclease [Planctomycetota bacterium]